MIQQNIALFISTENQKELLLKAILMMYLNQSIERLYQTYKNIFGKCSGSVIDSFVSYTNNISRYIP